MMLARPVELGQEVMVLLPHNISGLLLEVVYNLRNGLIWLDTDEQMDMVLVNLVYLNLEVPVLLLRDLHCFKKVVSYRIENLPPVLGREDKMIPQEGLCMVKSFILAHNSNIVKFLSFDGAFS